MGIPKITEMAINNALFGGGKREGTAIPVGKQVEQIYFNIENTIEETNAYLSQLTYTETALAKVPLCPIFAWFDPEGNGYTGIFVYAYYNGSDYGILFCTDILNQNYEPIYTSDNHGASFYKNGWGGGFLHINGSAGLRAVIPALVAIGKTGASEWGGYPVGAENEKIKNVLSITPF